MAKITKELIKVAAKNGIGYETLKTRVYNLGFDPIQAATTPIQKQSSPWAAWKEKAEKNGVSCGKFYNRLARGWEEKRAAGEQ